MIVPRYFEVTLLLAKRLRLHTNNFHKDSKSILLGYVFMHCLHLHQVLLFFYKFDKPVSLKFMKIHSSIYFRIGKCVYMLLIFHYAKPSFQNDKSWLSAEIISIHIRVIHHSIELTSRETTIRFCDVTVVTSP